MSRAYSVLHALIRKYFGSAACVTAALLLVGNAAAQKPSDEVFTATSVITLPGGQKITAFDISFVDPGLGVYILADRTNKSVDVIDTTGNGVTVQLTSNKCPTIATPCPFAGATGNNDTSCPDGGLIIGKEVAA